MEATWGIGILRIYQYYLLHILEADNHLFVPIIHLCYVYIHKCMCIYAYVYICVYVSNHFLEARYRVSNYCFRYELIFIAERASRLTKKLLTPGLR